MRIIEILIVGFMLIAIPVIVLGQGNNPAYAAAHEGGDVDEVSHPWTPLYSGYTGHLKESRVDQNDIIKAKEAVAKSLGAKFANKGDFARQISKAKRYLPYKTLQQAAVIEQAEADLKHPRMRKLVD